MPDALTFAILCLSAYRLTRLAGWDDFPLAARVRGWVIGERWVPQLASEPHAAEIDPGFWKGTAIGDAPSLPGKQPSSEAEGVRPAYDRPMLAHLVHCPFCLSFWVSLALYGFWLWQPYWTVVATMPFVLSGVVGLISKNLDP